MTRTLWTKEDLEILETHYPLGGYIETNKYLNKPRTAKAIQLKAFKLGIRSPNNKKKTLDKYNEELFECKGGEYKALDYVSAHITVQHVHAPCGEVFSATPHEMLKVDKRSCPNCLSMRQDSKTIYCLYIPDLDLYKIGITKNLSRRVKEFGTSVDIVYSKNMQSYHEAKTLEKHLLSKVTKISSGLLNSGNTETFKASQEEILQLGKYFS